MQPPRWESSNISDTRAPGVSCTLLSRAVILFAIGSPNTSNCYIYSVCVGAVLRMALDLLQVEARFSTSWLVPVSGFTAACIGKICNLILQQTTVCIV